MSKFMIKSIDSYNEKSFEMVNGLKKEENNKIIYEYKSKLGDCKISFHDEKIFIHRENDGIKNVIEVDLNNKTEFLYCGEGFKKNFHILGEKITYKKNILEFSYKILDNGEEVNNVSITIKEY
ncbi:hypothetical protein [uncultured Fusobacterium sp.]|uniref:hypothetical protein n=1 Tax=uncultured Fusobacterium sp. TaxID=159267 RepID=UPI0027DD7DBB|nr:hypothetical protein [uncultured Fusobacterium sp.]